MPTKVVDMSHPLDDTTVYWPGGSTFVLEEVLRGRNEKGYW